jgi:Tyrosine phosphatase family
MTERPPRARRLRFWPWLVLALTAIPAVWYVLDFENDIDPELPGVVRPTFSPFPPAAYRFAEACDTIDHVAVYVSSAALVLAAWGWFRNPRDRIWAAAVALSAAGFWHAATPGPLADGWYGLGWRTIFDPRAPATNRLILAALAAGVTAIVVRALTHQPFRSAWNAARAHGVLGLLIAAAVLMVARQVGWLDWEPIGFWPRWVYVWGLFAWAFALVRVVPPAPPGWSRALIVGLMFLVSLGLDFTGRGLFWYQRPIARLREMVPGRLYLSAMPTYLGLKLAQDRYHFRTIINLYPEYTPEQSPHWKDELRFAREHGLNYVGNESPEGAGGEDFVAQTLELSRKPEAWPILVHCHASMDRSPAWVGIYRFVVQGWPLVNALREIERHRGLRPKAAVTVLYTQLLPKIAPERCAQDATFALLKECAAGSGEPEAQFALRPRAENPSEGTRRSAEASSRQ